MSDKTYETWPKSSEESMSPQAAQSQEQKNDEEQERKRRLRGSFIKFGALAVFAFVVWLFATISWFANSHSNTAGGMGVRIGTDSYQIFPVDGNESIFQGYYNYIKNYSSDALVWNMTANSNMENYNSGTDDGIGPGSYGKIEFLVKPRDTSINLDLTFEIVGYKYEKEEMNSETNEITPASMTCVNNEMQKYLAGHIFLFQNRTPVYYKDSNGDNTDRVKTYMYSDPILSGTSLSKKISGRTFTKADMNNDGVLDDDIPVTIYWIWPKTLSTLVDASDNDNVSIEPFCVKNSDAYTDIVNHIIAHPDYYFYDTSSEAILNEGIISEDYDTYGSKYDRTDNEIGKNVSYITLKMTTNEVTSVGS